MVVVVLLALGGVVVAVVLGWGGTHVMSCTAVVLWPVYNVLRGVDDGRCCSRAVTWYVVNY